MKPSATHILISAQAETPMTARGEVANSGVRWVLTSPLSFIYAERSFEGGELPVGQREGKTPPSRLQSALS